MQFFVDNFPLLRDAFLTTLSLSLLSGLLALVLGTLLAAFRVSPITPLRWVGAAYVEVLRNMPLLTLLVLVVFGLPDIGVRFSLFTSAAIEVFLTMAIQTLPRGGTTVRKACGSTTSRRDWPTVSPSARDASAWPAETALMPDRTASLTKAAVYMPTASTEPVKKPSAKSICGSPKMMKKKTTVNGVLRKVST